jgi:hypothetical protein
MVVSGNKYRRKKANQAATLTLASGDSITAASGSTVTVASGATLALNGTTTVAAGATLTQPAVVELSEVVTATNVLTAAESGKTFYLNAAAGFLTTLPSPAIGLNYKFVTKSTPTSNGYTIGTPTADIIFGMAVGRDGAAGVAASAEDLITLVANQTLPGDWLEVRSDGTNWYVHGMVDVAAGVTFTVT